MDKSAIKIAELGFQAHFGGLEHWMKHQCLDVGNLYFQLFAIVSAGYIYVLTNRSMPGLVKVGKTVRDPLTRMNELSGATGVPTPFELAFTLQFDDCHTAERRIHQLLSERGTRVSNRREFFQVSPNTARILLERHREAELGNPRWRAFVRRITQSVLVAGMGTTGVACVLFLAHTPMGSPGTGMAVAMAVAGAEMARYFKQEA